MLCHWRYVLDNLFGEVKISVMFGRLRMFQLVVTNRENRMNVQRTTRRTRRLNSKAESSPTSIPPGVFVCAATILFTMQIDGSKGSAVAGLRRLLDSTLRRDAAAGLESGYPKHQSIISKAGRRFQNKINSTTLLKSNGSSFCAMS